MKATALFVFLVLISSAAMAAPPVVTITGKLANRTCSVIDVFGLQPVSEYRCTLVFSAQQADGTTSYWSVYCPNKAVDGQPQNLAFDVCSDPAAMQINHPTANYAVTGWLRTAQQAADNFGSVQGYSFSY